LSREDMTFFLPGWRAVDGAGRGLAGVTVVFRLSADIEVLPFGSEEL
jgi:hypothetical protein